MHASSKMKMTVKVTERVVFSKEHLKQTTIIHFQSPALDWEEPS
jgi:hypothetical protein